MIFFAMGLTIGGMTVVSCDPCAGVVCTDGSCSNGTCLCNEGYKKDHNKCIAFNMEVAGVDLVATELLVDSTSNFTKNTTYTIVAEPSNPYKFTLKSFNGIAKNDVTFTIKSSNNAVLETETVTTAAAKTYKVSGSKTASLLQLKLEAAPKTWTIEITL